MLKTFKSWVYWVLRGVWRFVSRFCRVNQSTFRQSVGCSFNWNDVVFIVFISPSLPVLEEDVGERIWVSNYGRHLGRKQKTIFGFRYNERGNKCDMIWTLIESFLVFRTTNCDSVAEEKRSRCFCLLHIFKYFIYLTLLWKCGIILNVHNRLVHFKKNFHTQNKLQIYFQF